MSEADIGGDDGETLDRSTLAAFTPLYDVELLLGEAPLEMA